MNQTTKTKGTGAKTDQAGALGRRRAARHTPGQVGIFWVFRGELLAAAYALRAGQEYGDAINGLTDHVKFWPRFQEQHRKLRDLEYQDVPRGRVLFMKPTWKFCVYMDKTLHTAKIKRAVLHHFDLPRNNTKFLMDAHYTTDPAELDRLFGGDSFTFE